MVQNSAITQPTTLDRDLEGVNALLTGGSRGIGAETARVLVTRGAQVVTTARHPRTDGPEGVHFIAGDLRTPDGIAAIASAATARLGQVDVIVNNAGAARTFPGGPLTIPDAEWLDSLGVNLLAAVRLNAALLPAMIDRGFGSIVHIASSAALSVPGPLLHYGAAKAALIAYSKGLATELAPRGIRVNTITPGNVESPGADEVRRDLATAFGINVADMHASVPVGHIGQPRDIAEAVAYLISNRASYITGTNLIIDGGEQTRP
jgi:NAD(P)-dependent dehydrogenase (short-subunit alcohol dehydrogenase family)